MTETRKTIIDVAAAAGVSQKTVSRVINGEPHVRPALAARVRAAIDRLNYVPNTAARSLAGTRSFMIAALFDNPSPFYLAQLQAGAMRACREAGYHLVLEQLALDRPDAIDDLSRRMQTARFDGVILSPPVTDCDGVLELLERRGIPYVRLSPRVELDRSPAIFCDDEGGARLVASHLWGLGHRHIGFVAGPPTHLASAVRRRGFLTSLLALGCSPDRIIEIEGDFSFLSGMEAGIQLIGDSGVSAIFACNDDMAAGVIAAAARLGRGIADDISVVGFDDSPVATILWPPLTTVRQPVEEMAAAASELIIRRGGGLSRIPVFPTSFIERHSTGISRLLLAGR